MTPLLLVSGVGIPRRHAADVDDAPAAALSHVGDALPGAADVAHYLDVDMVQPVLIGQLHEGRGGGVDRVVYQDVHPAQLGDGGGDEVLDVLGHAGVRPHRQRPAASAGADVGGGVLQLLNAPGADGDVHALLRQRQRRRPPDTLTAAGDDGDLAFQSEVHASLLRLGNKGFRDSLPLEREEPQELRGPDARRSANLAHSMVRQTTFPLPAPSLGESLSQHQWCPRHINSSA